MIVITDIKKLNTMHEKFGDSSNHKCCQKCGFCIECGDCHKFGCGAKKP